MPFIAVGIGLGVVKPFLIPISLIAFVHAWAIPELYAARGAKVMRPRGAKVVRPRAGGEAVRPPAGGEAAAERRALGLLGDLVDHRARELLARTGLVLERGQLGSWLVGEAGAVLVRHRGRRVHCYCVRPTDPALPPGDRIAHLLLALREDELGFATIANLAFSGAPWRVRRRLGAGMRPALDAAVTTAKAGAA